MKLTEMQLLQAIGQADEKTVNRTAPRQPEETGRLPIRIRRRALEMIAVCAALCIFVGGGFLIRNLYRAQNPVMPYSDDEAAARDAIEQFFAACQKGDRDKMLSVSLLDTVSHALYEDDPDSAEETIRNYLDAFSHVTDYRILQYLDATENLNRARQTELDLTELEIYRLESKGMYEEAEKLRKPNAVMDYYSHADKEFGFQVAVYGSGDGYGDFFEQEEYWIGAVRYDGKWYAQPVEYGVPSLSEEGRQMLEEFRANDPNHQGNAERTGTDEPPESADEGQTPENDLPEYENNAKWKTWSTADTKKAEQQFSGGEIQAGMPVIELTEAKLPPAGGTALSLLVGPEYTVPYTVSFDFRMPDASPGVLNFVTCYGANTVPDDEPYGEQRYWYKLQPNGMISYETSFGHGSEEFRGFLEKNASEQCFDPKKWNTMSLKTTETGTEVFINGVFAASLLDPNGMRSDLTGRLALDGAEGMMLRHFVFEDGIS